MHIDDNLVQAWSRQDHFRQLGYRLDLPTPLANWAQASLSALYRRFPLCWNWMTDRGFYWHTAKPKPFPLWVTWRRICCCRQPGKTPSWFPNDGEWIKGVKKVFLCEVLNSHNPTIHRYFLSQYAGRGFRWVIENRIRGFHSMLFFGLWYESVLRPFLR